MTVNIQHAQYGWLTSASVFTVFLAIVVAHGTPAHAHRQSTAPRVKLDLKTSTDRSGFYCNLRALGSAERDRLRQLAEKLKAARLETKELPDGYAFRLNTELVSISDLAEWISSERKCCPFFDFEIELQRDRGPLWLKLRGPEGVKEFLRHEFATR
jgi:hypothetical protein